MKIDLDKSRDFLRRFRLRERVRKVANPLGYLSKGYDETLETVRYISERVTLR